MPADDAISTYEIASLIAGLGLHYGELVRMADLRDVRLSRVGAFLDVTSELVRRGQRIVFATRSISKNLATIPLARAADRVVLCASIGSTLIGVVEETIAQIGKERFLGSVLIGKPGSGRRASRPPRSSAQDRLVRDGS